MIYKLDTQIKSGKHQGYTIQEVIDNDPDYIEWFCENVEWFELDEEAADRLDKVLYADDLEDYSWHEVYGRLA